MGKLKVIAVGPAVAAVVIPLPPKKLTISPSVIVSVAAASSSMTQSVKPAPPLGGLSCSIITLKSPVAASTYEITPINGSVSATLVRSTVAKAVT